MPVQEAESNMNNLVCKYQQYQDAAVEENVHVQDGLYRGKLIS